MIHLPECQHVEMTEDDYEANCGFYAPPDCICDALRACEQRVRQECGGKVITHP